MNETSKYLKSVEEVKINGNIISLESYVPIYSEEQKIKVKREVKAKLYNVFKKYIPKHTGDNAFKSEQID